MSVIKGHSGAAVLAPDGGSDTVVHNVQWSVDIESIIREATTPNLNGWTEALPKAQTIRQVELRWHDRDSNSTGPIYPILGFLVPGLQIRIYLRRGEKPQWYAIQYAIITRLSSRNTPRTARAWELVACHGEFYQITKDKWDNLEALLR